MERASRQFRIPLFIFFIVVISTAVATATDSYLGRPLEYWTEQATATDRTESIDRIVEALTLAVSEEDIILKVPAADALQSLGPKAKPAIQACLDTLDHPQPWVRVAVMDVLASIGPDGVPMIADFFSNSTGGPHIRSALVLAAMGPEAKAALPALEEAAANAPDNMKARYLSIIGVIKGAGSGPDVSQRKKAVFSDDDGTVPELAMMDAADWPQFHGPNRDGICRETGLLREWPKEGPALLWKLDSLGKGYSSIAIANGTIFTMGDRPVSSDEEAQFAIAYDLASRRERWAVRIGPPHKDGSRCTPTVDGDRVYALGTSSDLLCLDAKTGKVHWQKNLERDFGGKMMSIWKFSESLLIDGPRLVCTPGGPDATMVALDKKTGATVWTCAAPDLGEAGKDGAAYSSAVVAEIAGTRQIVQLLGRGVIGVDAESGRFLWGYNRIANGIANVTRPIVRGDYVFATTSYRTGSVLLHIAKDGETFKAEEVYFLGPREFENHHGGLVLVGDYVYGGDGLNRGRPACVELSTGKIKWKQDEQPAKGSAAVLYADGHLIFRYDRGPVALIEATPEAYRLKGLFTPVTTKGPAWAHPVIYRGKLYLRHNELLLCYDLRR